MQINKNSKKNALRLSKGNSLVMGVSKVGQDWQFCCVAEKNQSLMLCLYDKDGVIHQRIDMLPYQLAGSVYSVRVSGIDKNIVEYGYELNGKPYRDIYKKASYSERRWGEPDQMEVQVRAGFYQDETDWEMDKPLKLPYHQVIGYSLHVRGFTKHVSSKVKNKGTFRGITEKIQYLLDLGINQIELMPAYEFYELDFEKEQLAEGHPKYTKNTKESACKINYWGFKEGSYFVPKASYSSSHDAVSEFKMLVKELHKNGIEIVMQFYFPKNICRNLVLDCLKFWVTDYHVDGFHLKGENLPIDLIASEPLLMDTKIYYSYFDRERIFYGKNKESINSFLAEINHEYATDIRRFLKSDEDMLQAFLYRQRRNPSDIHAVNSITFNEGFTLNDLVSYDYKHNEENGEENKDGENYNYSWNCGVEGSTRKKSVHRLRMKQMKNAMTFLLLSQGMPMLLSGDEFCNSQHGNNNSYCQDNEISWLNWKQTKQSQELYTFVKKLIAIRKEHPILHKDMELRIMDYAACGYPDLSYHADAAWYPKLENYVRHVGIMLCGKYARIDRLHEDVFFFIAYNMHWEAHTFGLPKLPKGMQWSYCFDTLYAPGTEEISEQLKNRQDELVVGERSIVVLTGM